ncbi:MAG: PcfJ domain-containing protein, partial [Vagococcus sp.]
YMSFGNLTHLYKFKFEIEYLQKIRATTIAREVTNNCQIDFRTITKKWLRVNKQLLKNNQDPFYVFELKRRVLERGGKVVPGIEEYMNYRDINSISKCVGIVSFQNWVIKNKVDMQFYRDYLGMLKDLNIKADDQNLVKPKDLKKAHDNVVKLMNEMNVARGDADIGKRLKSTMKLEKDIDDYVFLVPKSLNELIVEGKSLHHCVGSSTYVEGHRKGQTTIVFVREKEYPNTPFFTLEFKNGQINQLRGKHNKAASKEVKQATERWLEWTRKNRRTAKKRSTRKTEFV